MCCRRARRVGQPAFAVLMVLAIAVIAVGGGPASAAGPGPVGSMAGSGGSASVSSVGPRGSLAAVQADGTGLPDPEPSADQARRAADEILARPEYQEPPKSLLEKVTEWFGKQLEKLFSSFTGGSGGGFAWVILALLVGAAIFLLSRVRGGVFRRRRVEREPLFETAVEARRSPIEWLAEADRLEAVGDWKAGLRARYRALVGGLIAEQILRDIPGRTTGEYRVEMRRVAVPVAVAFAEASDLFERAWYGDEPTGPVESRQFRKLAARIGEQAGRRDEPVGVPS